MEKAKDRLMLFPWKRLHDLLLLDIVVAKHVTLIPN